VYPSKFSEIAWVAGGTFFLALLHGSRYFSWPYADWSAISAESRQALSLSGPWAATCCAWSAARFTQNRGIVASPVAARMGVGLVVAQLPRIGAAAITGYAAGLAPLLVRTSIEAKAGNPNLLTIAGAFACLLAFICGGYLIGAVLPLRSAVVVALVGSVAVVLLADILGPAVSPIWTTDVVAGQRENGTLGLFRLVFFSAAAACCVAVACVWLQFRRIRPRLGSLAGLGVLTLAVMLVVLIAIDLDWKPVLHEAQSPQSCAAVGPRFNDGARGATLCIHKARSPVLMEAAKATSAAREAAGELSRSTVQIVDVNLWAEPKPGQIILQVQPQDPAWEQYIIEDLAFELSGTAFCAQSLSDPILPSQIDAVATSAGFGIWIARQAGGDGAGISTAPDAMQVATRLERLPPLRVRALMATMKAELSSCSASSRSLP
jgi:hypothetical protein